MSVSFVFSSLLYPGETLYENVYEDSTIQLPSAEEIMMEVRASMPSEPLLIRGRLLSGRRLGVLKHRFNIQAHMTIKNDAIAAKYTLIDYCDKSLEELTIIRNKMEPVRISYQKAYPLKPAPLPELDSMIENTDMTWNDLTLSFLWLKDGRTIGKDNKLARDCFILEFPVGCGSSSAKEKNLTTQSDSPCRLRLWIDEKLFMFIQMEEYDANGKRRRRLSIKKIKKISDKWMIKEMEIRSYPERNRTLLRIDKLVSERGKEQL